jgi:hypothetical protein
MFYFIDVNNSKFQIELSFVVGNLPPNFMKTRKLKEVMSMPLLDLTDPYSDMYRNSRTVYAKTLNKLGIRDDIDIYIYIEECKIKSDLDGIDYKWIKNFVDNLPVLDINQSEKEKAFICKDLFDLDFVKIYSIFEAKQIFESIPTTSPEPVITSPIVTVTETATIAPATLPPPYTSPSP